MSELKNMEPDQALVAYSLPGSDSFIAFKANFVRDALNDTNLKLYDFVMSPFDREVSDCLWFSFQEEIQEFPIEHEALKFYNEVETSKDAYIESAEELMENFKASPLEKMVLSRTKFNPSSKPVNIYKLYSSLCQTYVNDFVCLVHIPEGLSWIGASPELLLGQEEGKLKTVALAGTQSLNADLDSISWGEKEVEEHRFIERFYEEVFGAEGKAYSKSESYTHPAGKMCHIRSDFYLDSSEDMAQVIELIHPGPALSGYPKEMAIEKIRSLEGHERSHYTGFWGPLKTDRGLQLFANIRCAELFEQGALMYLGGGYTRDSIIESEWRETELKSTTLAQVLNKDHAVHDNG